MKIPADVARMMGLPGAEERPVLDSLPVPKQHVVKVLELLQKLRDLEASGNPMGRHAGRYEMWSFLHEVMPFTRGKSCQIATAHPTRPVVEVLGDVKVPTPGKRGVAEVYRIPPEHFFRLFELMDLEDTGPIHSYNLWTFIGSIIPEVAAKEESDWTITMQGNDIYVVRRATDEEDA